LLEVARDADIRILPLKLVHTIVLKIRPTLALSRKG